MMSGHGLSVRQELTGVVEDHHSVAEQTPALFRVEGHQLSRVSPAAGR